MELVRSKMEGWMGCLNTGGTDGSFSCLEWLGLDLRVWFFYFLVRSFHACAAWAPPAAACAAVWIWMMSPFFFSILAWTSLICVSSRELRKQRSARSFDDPWKCYSHLLVDKLQTAVDGALGVGPILLEQDWPDQLVDGLVILELGKLLFNG